MLFFNFLFSLFFINIRGQNWRDKRPTAKIEEGVIEGIRIQSESGKIINAFLGVPYAAPPIGKNRFAPPQKHSEWNRTYQATNFGSHCPQLPLKPGINDNENCLFLNIWSPETIGIYAPLPVVVFFEGRDFARSSDLPISGEDLAAENLIIVTINYRLNIFGFFCLGTWDARGNFGLLDQYFSLIWIKRNIQHFGGDPEKITLYGHLSGAVSVTLHMISPRTAGLFQRAIISSGSVLAPWQRKNDPIIASKQILRLLGCDVYTINPISCLRSKKVEHILQALEEYTESISWTNKFLPVVDNFLPENNRYLPYDPEKVLKDGTYLQVPILTGISKPITNEQFMDWLEMASQGYPQLQQYIEKSKIPEILRLYKFDELYKQQLKDFIIWKYFSYNHNDVRILFDQLKQLEFDAKFLSPNFLQWSYFINTYVQPIYVYFLNDIGFVLNSTDSTITTDLLLIFGPFILKQVGKRRFSQKESFLSKQLKQLWINFIYFGNPTPNNDNQVKVWRKYTSIDYYIENLDTFPINNDENNRKIQTILFWNQLLPKINSIRCGNSIPKELQNSPDPAAGFRHAMYTLLSLVIALLILLLICIVLLKKKTKKRENHIHIGY